LKSLANMMKLRRKQQVHKETNQPAEVLNWPSAAGDDNLPR
jgi:hypothetical protein